MLTNGMHCLLGLQLIMTYKWLFVIPEAILRNHLSLDFYLLFVMKLSFIKDGVYFCNKFFSHIVVSDILFYIILLNKIL